MANEKFQGASATSAEWNRHRRKLGAEILGKHGEVRHNQPYEPYACLGNYHGL